MKRLLNINSEINVSGKGFVSCAESAGEKAMQFLKKKEFLWKTSVRKGLYKYFNIYMHIKTGMKL